MFGNVALRSVKIDIDEDLLQKIASETGGRYFRATDTSSLENIYAEIDKLETTPMEETGYNIYRQLFPFVLIPALILFFFGNNFSQHVSKENTINEVWSPLHGSVIVACAGGGCFLYFRRP